jgi:hypothetical protein
MVETTYSKDEEVHEPTVHLTLLEHALRSDGTPDDRCVVDHFGSSAGETLRVVRIAEIFDVAKHPAEYCRRDVNRHTKRCECSKLRTTCLHCGSQDS